MLNIVLTLYFNRMMNIYFTSIILYIYTNFYNNELVNLIYYL